VPRILSAVVGKKRPAVGFPSLDSRILVARPVDHRPACRTGAARSRCTITAV